MQVGEKITIPFGKKEIEGIVERLCPKTVYIRADFPHHKGKLIRRKLALLNHPKAKKKK